MAAEGEADAALVIGGVGLIVLDFFKDAAFERIITLQIARSEKIRQGKILSPLDPKKNNTSMTAHPEPDFQGAWECCHLLLRTQGSTSLWRGLRIQIFTGVLRSLDEKVTMLTVPRLLQFGLTRVLPAGFAIRHPQVIKAAKPAFRCFYHGLGTLFVYPLSVTHLNVLCQMPTTPKEQKTLGMRSFFEDVKHNEEHGVFALYRGYWVEIARLVLGALIEKVCSKLWPEAESDGVEGGGGPKAFLKSIVRSFLLREVLQAFLLHPLIVVANRLQLTVGAGKMHRYQGIRDVTYHILHPQLESSFAKNDGDGDPSRAVGDTPDYSQLWTGFATSLTGSALGSGLMSLGTWSYFCVYKRRK